MVAALNTAQILLIHCRVFI